MNRYRDVEAAAYHPPRNTASTPRRPPAATRHGAAGPRLPESFARLDRAEGFTARAKDRAYRRQVAGFFVAQSILSEAEGLLGMRGSDAATSQNMRGRWGETATQAGRLRRAMRAQLVSTYRHPIPLGGSRATRRSRRGEPGHRICRDRTCAEPRGAWRVSWLPQRP